MESPLHVLYEHLTKGNNDQPLPLLADQLKFNFSFRYPEGEGYQVSNLLHLRAEVEWSPAEGGIFLTVCEPAIEFPLRDLLEDFCVDLYQEADLFISSMIVGPVEYSLAGHLHLVPYRQKLVPAFGTYVPFEEGDSPCDIIGDVETNLEYAALFACVVHPVFTWTAQAGRPPNAAQRMKLLLVAHGNMQVLRRDADHSKDEPPPFFFPQGLYGGKVSNRTQ